MDIEKLIERLKHNYHGYSTVENNPEETFHDMVECLTALSTLQAENEKLRAELEQKEKYYEQMVDALAATESAELEQVKRERRIIPKGYALVKLKLLEELDNFRELGPIGRLRELKQADDEGRCVVLSAKLHDKLYYVDKEQVRETEVESIHNWTSGRWKLSTHTDRQSTHWIGYEVDFDGIGKTVFLTREEAEAALRREQDG